MNYHGDTSNLPKPRIQFVWTVDRDFPSPQPWPSRGNWICLYQIVLELSEFDIRLEPWNKNRELVLDMGLATMRESNQTPCLLLDKYYPDLPWRDGTHAHFDNYQLGGLPIFVRAPDGTWLQYR